MGKNFMLGEVIHGYTITSPMLSNGTFAMSFLAEDYSGNEVFLKEYIDPIPTIGWYDGFVSYQEKLQDILRKMPSSIIQGSIDLFEEDGMYFQVFPKLEGKSLQDLMNESADDFSVFSDELRWVSAKLFMYTMSILHDNNIVHCDLKPDNVFMENTSGTGSGRRIKVIDYDFSFISGTTPPWIPQGADGRPGYVGTYGYFSPEHLTAKTPTFASDVFTCGIILYEILCGRYPVTDYSDNSDYLKQYKEKSFPKPSELNSDIQEGLSEIMYSMLDVNPDARPSIHEVHKELLNPSSEFAEFIKLRIDGSNEYKPVNHTQIFLQHDFRRFESYKYISSPQFKITKDKAKEVWLIEGLTGVKNNTRLNGEIVTGRSVELKEGDIISVGKFETVVNYP